MNQEKIKIKELQHPLLGFVMCLPLLKYYHAQKKSKKLHKTVKIHPHQQALLKYFNEQNQYQQREIKPREQTLRKSYQLIHLSIYKIPCG